MTNSKDVSKNNSGNNFAYKTFAVVCLGCKVNRAEVDEISAQLLWAGWRDESACNADVVIVNTCTVTHVADKKTRQTVRRVCAENTSASSRIIVTGCAATMQPQIYRDMDSRVEVVAKAEVVHTLLLGLRDLADGNNNLSFSQPQHAQNNRSRASLKIQDGCNNSCTYCIVHTARGPARSLPVDEVMQKFNVLLEAGYKEIVLSGVDLGAYNYEGVNLAQICEKMLDAIDAKFADIAGVDIANNSVEELHARIRISSIEPQSVDDGLIKLMSSSNGKICRHLHLPLQSGSTKVLREMNRHYTAEQYLGLVDKLRRAMPTLSLSTDIIVGFPGETEEDFAATCDIARKCGFMKIHVFPYSMREGTPAAERVDQVPDEIKAQRAKILRGISEELRLADLQKRADTSEFALVETNNKARTESYHLIDFVGKNPSGQLVHVLL